MAIPPANGDPTPGARQWRRLPPALWAAILALALLAPVLAAPANAVAARPSPSAPECGTGSDAEFLGFSDALDKTTFADTAVGGLSALTYDRRRDVYYSLVDNQGTTAARLYTLRLPLDSDGLGAPTVLDVTTLRDAAGQPYTGATFDGEGLVLTPQGDLLISSETEPSIRRFAPDGRLLEELPVPQRFRFPAAGGGARGNLTFESLALSPNGRSLFTATEGYLIPDDTTAADGQRIRILRYEDRGPGGFVPGEEYFYLTDPNLGVVEVVALSERELLVLERGFAAGQGNTVRAYRVSLDGAADVSGAPSLATAGVAPLAKELLFDLADCPPSGATNPGMQVNPLLDNFESLALGPHLPGGRRALLLQSDDNFNAAQVTRVIALALPARELNP